MIELLEKKVDVILCGRACDTAIYASPCIYEGYDPGLAFHMAKIMECGAMCSEPVAAADVMQGYMYEDYFELRPASPERKCSAERAAAHTMYEQTNPYLIYEPDGVIDIKNAEFKQVDERTVRISGVLSTERFISADKSANKERMVLLGVILDTAYSTASLATVRIVPSVGVITEEYACFTPSSSA